MIEGLPQWRCHKVVGAFKITRIERAQTLPESPHITRYRLSGEYFAGHHVEVGLSFFRARSSDNLRDLTVPADYIGGYLVQYEDGYLSWSPADAFEKGYTRIADSADVAVRRHQLNSRAYDHGLREGAEYHKDCPVCEQIRRDRQALDGEVGAAEC